MPKPVGKPIPFSQTNNAFLGDSVQPGTLCRTVRLRSSARLLINSASPQTIRLVPDLSAASLRLKLTKELALWYCLRAINHWGSGFLDKGMAIDALVEYFGYSIPTAYRHLALGEGKFWRTNTIAGRTWIEIYGLRVVAVTMGITQFSFDRHFRELPFQDFNTTSRRKSQVYASCLKPDGIKGCHPISRASLQNVTGVSKQQARRYEKAAGVKRTPNYGVYTLPDGSTVSQTITVCSKSKSFRVNKRLGNSYHSQQTPSKKGMLRKVKSTARSLITGEALVDRRYFPSLRRLVSILSRPGNGQHEGYYRVRPSSRIIPARLEWGAYGVYV